MLYPVATTTRSALSKMFPPSRFSTTHPRSGTNPTRRASTPVLLTSCLSAYRCRYSSRPGRPPAEASRHPVPRQAGEPGGSRCASAGGRACRRGRADRATFEHATPSPAPLVSPRRPIGGPVPHDDHSKVTLYLTQLDVYQSLPPCLAGEERAPAASRPVERGRARLPPKLPCTRA